MESRLGLKLGLKKEAGQTLTFVALVVTVLVLFAVFLIDYAKATATAQEAVMAADLAVHAGVQQIMVEPDGDIVPAPNAPDVVKAYFEANKPPGASLTRVQCDTVSINGVDVPHCELTAFFMAGGHIGPARAITIEASAYLPYGATREGQ